MELKQLMTFDEMAQHYAENNPLLPNNKNVGTYARRLGFDRIKQTVSGKRKYYYYNKNISK